MKNIIKISSITILLFINIGCSNSKPNTTKNSTYYTDLREICQSKPDKNCCLASVDAMERDLAKLVPKTGCKEGYKRDMFKCISSFSWCRKIIVAQDLTSDEKYKRAELVAQALSKKKIFNNVVFFDERKKIIQIELKLPTNAKAPTLDDLMGIIKEELKQSSLRKEAQFIKKGDIDLKIIRGEEEIVNLE